MLRLPALGQLDQSFVSPATSCIPVGLSIFLYTAPTDMRQGFDTLAALVRGELGQDPLSGSLFVFRSGGGNRLKILYWDSDGYALWYKRLEQGTFCLPKPTDGQTHLSIRPSELAMLLEGIDLRSIRRRPRYRLAVGTPAVP